jgi:uncharacterized membrane protein YadS
VLAATLPVSVASAQIGTLVKLTRVVMLGPVVIILGLLHKTSRPGQQPKLLVPWFVLGFVVMGVARSANILPPWLPGQMRIVATVLTVLSMAALGLAVDARSLIRVGGRVTAAVVGALAVLLGLSIALVSALAIR